MSKSMKIQVSHVMVSFLNNNIQEYSFSLKKETAGFWDSASADYDYKTDTVKRIYCWYPPEYYALPRILSTEELNRIFKRCDHTVAGFIQAMRAALEI